MRSQLPDDELLAGMECCVAEATTVTIERYGIGVVMSV
jgi:hypothetical protein